MAQVNPAGETGHSSNKCKATKKQETDSAKKRPNLKLDLSKIKKGMIQTTIDQWLLKPRTPTRVRFIERVMLKKITSHMESWTGIPLKGFSDPGSAFAKKGLDMECHMARDHYWRRQRPTPRNANRVTHILTKEDDARKYQTRMLTVYSFS